MEYLKTYVFPSRTQGLGPSVRSADFAEILVADYFQFLANWLVPRIRYRFKAIPDESTKGTDILAFQLAGGTNLAKEVYSANDVMLCVEVKAQFSGSAAPSKLQEAIDHSAKDQYRKGLSLNAMHQRLRQIGDLAGVQLVTRFQNPTDHPYLSRSAATAFYCESVFKEEVVSTASTAQHPESGTLVLFVFKGQEMMKLVHRLYEVAANEA